PRHLTTTLTPKATAATNLHTLTHHHPLHTFLLFSSITATTGTPGQANYAAANAYLDALAHHRHTHHLPATSIAWGLWNPTPSDTNTPDDTPAPGDTPSTGGMAAALGKADLSRLARAGIAPLPAEQALRMFDQVFAGRHADQALVVASRFDTRALASPGAAVPPPLRSLVRNAPRSLTRAGTRPGVTAPARPELASRLARASAGEADRLLVELVRETVALVLGHTDTASVPEDRPLTDLGLDSLAAVDLRNRLG
ncbi:beta-ketoacyl reductase, partial [Frankia sp. EI5c]|uniref:beta-ketoacyl reductase n=1 Tax=Frankia sp. EI5c TaxID=683316 RepID=UPI001F5C048B